MHQIISVKEKAYYCQDLMRSGAKSCGEEKGFEKFVKEKYGITYKVHVLNKDADKLDDIFSKAILNRSVRIPEDFIYLFFKYYDIEYKGEEMLDIIIRLNGWFLNTSQSISELGNIFDIIFPIFYNILFM